MVADSHIGQGKIEVIDMILLLGTLDRRRRVKGSRQGRSGD